MAKRFKYNFEKNGKKKTRLKILIAALVFVALAAAAFFVYPGIANAISESRVNETESLSREGDVYYNSLSYRDQLLYDSVRDAALGHASVTETVGHSYDAETFGRIVKFIRADMPELFWVDFDSLVLNHGRYRTNVTMKYFIDKGALPAMQEELDAALNEGVAAAEGAAADFEKELAVHDWLTARCASSDAEDDLLHNTAYGALVKKSAYCGGYACAVKLILDRIGIKCAVVYGSVESGDHMWNLVYIDGAWHHLDVTWDDADITYEENLLFHGYFNLTDEAIELDHTFDFGEILPDAAGESDYYSVRELRAASAKDTEEIFFTQLKAAAADKGAYIELCCDETADNEVLKPYYKKAVERVNAELGSEVFLEAFQLFSASGVSNACTIQIFYN